MDTGTRNHTCRDSLFFDPFFAVFIVIPTENERFSGFMACGDVGGFDPTSGALSDCNTDVSVYLGR